MLRKTASNLVINLLASRAVSSMMTGVRKQAVPIFMIHRVNNPAAGVRGHDKELIRAALSYSKDHHYQCLSLRDLATNLRDGKSIPANAVCFTMDDGFADQAEEILPIFQEFKVPITFFIATDMLDHQAWSWDSKLDYLFETTSVTSVNTIVAGTPFSETFSDAKTKRALMRRIRDYLKKQSIQDTHQAITHLSAVLGVKLSEKAPNTYRPMTWDQARTLESEYIEFAPHSCQHAVLTQFDDEQSRYEIEKSWQRLKEELANPSPIFCYPTGRKHCDFKQREKDFVQQAGLIAAVSADPGYLLLNKDNIDLYDINRFSFPEDNLPTYKQYCSWVERAKELMNGST